MSAMADWRRVSWSHYGRCHLSLKSAILNIAVRYLIKNILELCIEIILVQVIIVSRRINYYYCIILYIKKTYLNCKIVVLWCTAFFLLTGQDILLRYHGLHKLPEHIKTKLGCHCQETITGLLFNLSGGQWSEAYIKLTQKWIFVGAYSGGQRSWVLWLVCGFTAP